VSHEEPCPFTPRELDAIIEPGLARYRPILPRPAIHHFRRVGAFVVETHPAAFRWLSHVREGGLGAASGLPEPSEADPIPEELVLAVAEAIGLRDPRSPSTDVTDTELHNAEAGLGFLVGVSFPKYETQEEKRRALGRFVDLTFASLFAGLLGALLRLYEKAPGDAATARTLRSFVWAVMLFRRFDLGARHSKTFNWYFMRPRPGRSVAVAKQLKRTVPAEEEDVLHFLDELAAFVAQEGPRLVSEIKTNPADLSDHSRPWALTLLSQELQKSARSKRKRGS
jgi:hypothetical protein